MPEPNVLYTVTAVVVAGLALWVAYVLKTAKDPWERKPAPAAGPAEGAEQAAGKPIGETVAALDAREGATVEVPTTASDGAEGAQTAAEPRGGGEEGEPPAAEASAKAD